MQQTSKYQFNLVEGSDDFSPTPLNQNMEKVEEALETIKETAEEKPYSCGVYIGNGGTQTVTLGFRPSFVVVNGAAGYNETMEYSIRHVGIFADGYTYDSVTVTDTGFTVQRMRYHYPELNESGKNYAYLAFQ